MKKREPFVMVGSRVLLSEELLMAKEESGSYGAAMAANSNVKYDLIGKLAGETELTRKALAAILKDYAITVMLFCKQSFCSHKK